MPPSRSRRRSSMSFPVAMHGRKTGLEINTDMAESSSSDYAILDETPIRSAPYDEDDESYFDSKIPILSDRVTSILGIIAFVLLFIYIITGVLWGPERYVPIRADTTQIEMTSNPIIVPNMNDIAMLQSNTVPKKAPNDNANAKDPVKRPPAVPNALKAPSVKTVLFDGGKRGPSPKIVVVTAIDYTRYKPEHLNRIIENRVEYARAQGYGTYIRFVQDFKSVYTESSTGSPSWAKLSVMRAALLAFPKAEAFWYLDQSGLIMDPAVDLEKYILNHKALEEHMLRGIPVIKTADYVRTYKFTKVEQVEFIITQDDEGLNPTSFILRSGSYAVSLLEYWNDVLYRTHQAFTRSESSALNHLAQWHPCYLSKLAVVPARYLAGFSATSPASVVDPSLAYQQGDFVVHQTCDVHAKTCTEEFQKLWNTRKRAPGAA